MLEPEHTLPYVTVDNQTQLDKLKYDDKRIIMINFGEPGNPAVLMTSFTQPVIVSEYFAVTSIAGNKIFAEACSTIEVSEGSTVILRDRAQCTVYGASYVYATEDSEVIRKSDAARIETTQRARYRPEEWRGSIVK